MLLLVLIAHHQCLQKLTGQRKMCGLSVKIPHIDAIPFASNGF